MFSSKLVGFPPPGLLPNGLGLRLLKLPMGLANPLVLPIVEAGATTEIWSPSSSIDARIEAALSRTDGTDCSSCSVALERGMRCGFWGWWLECGGEGFEMGSMSRSKMADDDECLD